MKTVGLCIGSFPFSREDLLLPAFDLGYFLEYGNRRGTADGDCHKVQTSTNTGRLLGYDVGEHRFIMSVTKRLQQFTTCVKIAVLIMALSFLW